MKVTYKGEELRFGKDPSGEHDVLWIQYPQQRTMEHMKCVGGYPSEYCIFIDELPKADQAMIYDRVRKGETSC